MGHAATLERSALMNILSKLLGCLVIFVQIGCTHSHITNEERETSFAQLESVRIERFSFREFAIARSALLVDKSREVSQADDDQESFTERSRKDMHLSIAIPIDKRGYFLTAAHCVGDSPVTLIRPERNGEPKTDSARIVWKGEASETGFDLALLKIESSVEHFFEWSSNQDLQQKTVSLGINVEIENEQAIATMDLTAGELVKIATRAHRGIRYKVLQHTTPLIKGDSGGALIGLNGKLIGVNFAAYRLERTLWTPFPRRSYAIRPNLIWLNGMIERDYGRRIGSP